MVFVQTVIGGPFLPHIEQIIRDRAAMMSSPVVSACDAGIRATIKGLGVNDIKIQVQQQGFDLVSSGNLLFISPLA